MAAGCHYPPNRDSVDDDHCADPRASVYQLHVNICIVLGIKILYACSTETLAVLPATGPCDGNFIQEHPSQTTAAWPARPIDRTDSFSIKPWQTITLAIKQRPRGVLSLSVISGSGRNQPMEPSSRKSMHIQGTLVRELASRDYQRSPSLGVDTRNVVDRAGTSSLRAEEHRT